MHNERREKKNKRWVMAVSEWKPSFRHTDDGGCTARKGGRESMCQITLVVDEIISIGVRMHMWAIESWTATHSTSSPDPGHVGVVQDDHYPVCMMDTH
jgi:hypothetical protein